MNPRYNYPKRSVSSMDRQQILKALRSNPSDKEIEYLAQEYDLKPRTIKGWLKQQSKKYNKASESDEDIQSNGRKTKADKDLLDFERNFNQNSDGYHYEITNMDLLKTAKNLNQQEYEKPQVVQTQKQQSTQQQSIKPLSSENFFTMKIDNQQQQQSQKCSLQNFDALLLLLDQDDEIHHMVTLLRNQEKQIEELKKTQSDILEYMCSHLTKKPKKI
ncbi:unnamed protein product (macronuclear) [Paramecium tetraurelia]|uniref:HTH psq-type domain-containing protein n=1 Tax=Paramecium tetraurelia TaxID=5888 RepID=A0CL49_PARTE|nr:uncharacterized protein GSPATT00008063001 [Paramecium tetraurelia]CAK71516.1 unnamed protein product [Paramecium tetraurelia]|eukprot:XP_001438913.1 hypothetical protein (macronuclear) [Paramecium tetraurelia strain d4-2]